MKPSLWHRLVSPAAASFLALFATVLLLAGCATVPASAPEARSAKPTKAVDTVVRVTLLHFNDVYEITPVEGGRRGGLARVASLRRRLSAENPDTFTVLAGDLFSPSALGTAKIEGEPLAGKQMVAVLNTLGLDLATFGNHEFDLTEDEFTRRMEEADFEWVSANVFDAAGKPFPGVLPHRIYTFGAGERQVRVGFFGVTITENRKEYVSYKDPLETAAQALKEMAGKADVLVALTHLDLASDIALAEAHPEIDLILGGHEHENYLLRRGADFTPIHKADANVRSVWVHRLAYDTAGGELSVDSRFVEIDGSLPDEPATAKAAEHWTELGLAGFRQEGFEPDKVVAEVGQPLDGREAVVRRQSTRLTELIASAMTHAVAGAEAAIYNSGSIRIDDVISPGPVTQYDVIRVLPFGGDVVSVRVTGKLLLQVLEAGRALAGSGGYLQTDGISGGGGEPWTLGGKPVVADQVYTVAMNDYLATGKQNGLEFLSPTTPGFEPAGTHGDVRKALIDELQRVFGAAP